MKTHFEQELSDLKSRLLTMASHAEAAVRQAVEAVVRRDNELAEQARAMEGITDRLELEIDEAAIHLLAKAPLASDLRLITVALRISQNLERIGDEACKIAKRARDLNAEAPLKQVAEIPGLSARALELLRHSLDAFVNGDPSAARGLIPQDKEVDALNKEIHGHLAAQMAESRESIAEETVFLCEAEDIRHRSKLAANAAATVE